MSSWVIGGARLDTFNDLLIARNYDWPTPFSDIYIVKLSFILLYYAVLYDFGFLARLVALKICTPSESTAAADNVGVDSS